jgi:hypothetical protein
MKKFIVIWWLIGGLFVVGCGVEPSEQDRQNKDPRLGTVYLYDNGDDQKICDGANLIYYTYGGAHNNESIAVVQNSPECAE